MFKLDDVEHVPFTVSIENGCMQHTSAKNLEYLSLCYHACLLSSYVTVHDCIIFPCHLCSGIAVQGKEKCARFGFKKKKNEKATLYVHILHDEGITVV